MLALFPSQLVSYKLAMGTAQKTVAIIFWAPVVVAGSRLGAIIEMANVCSPGFVLMEPRSVQSLWLLLGHAAFRFFALAKGPGVVGSIVLLGWHQSSCWYFKSGAQCHQGKARGGHVID